MISLGAFGASATTLDPLQIRAEIKADDEFKIYLSSTATDAGVQFGQGLGWNLGYDKTLLRIPGVTTYYLNIWVRDIGGAPTGLVGQFTMTLGSGCRFSNGSNNLTTNTRHWKVTEALPHSTVTGPALPGVPSEGYFRNDQPLFVQPTLTPVDLGTNIGPNPWSSIAGYSMQGIAAGARWIREPGSTDLDERWYQTVITCANNGGGRPIQPPPVVPPAN